jgi:hypothetical protein
VKRKRVVVKQPMANVITTNTTAKQLNVNANQELKHALQMEQLTRAIVQDSAKVVRPAMTGEMYLYHEKDPLPVVCQVHK